LASVGFAAVFALDVDAVVEEVVDVATSLIGWTVAVADATGVSVDAGAQSPVVTTSTYIKAKM
jgi:hypothetical protein